VGGVGDESAVVGVGLLDGDCERGAVVAWMLLLTVGGRLSMAAACAEMVANSSAVSPWRPPSVNLGRRDGGSMEDSMVGCCMRLRPLGRVDPRRCLALLWPWSLPVAEAEEEYLRFALPVLLVLCVFGRIGVESCGWSARGA
jgi:hypothetical protein